jgi:uncharacterized cupredoxin-like copper-binding protein
MRKTLSRLGGAAAVALLLATGCSTSQPAGGASVHVSERDFHVSAPASVPAGDVQLAVSNRGPEAHELIVVRAHASGLPLRADGLTVNEEALDPVVAGTLEPGDPGSRRDLQVHLVPGRYELFCNMSGHYLGGMHTDLVVR